MQLQTTPLQTKLPVNEAVNQGLILLFRVHTSCDWTSLSVDDSKKLRARAMTLIDLGRAMLQRLDARKI